MPDAIAIDGRMISRLVAEYDSLKWLLNQSNNGIHLSELSASGATGLANDTRQTINELLSRALAQISAEEMDRVRNELKAMGVGV